MSDLNPNVAVGNEETTNSAGFGEKDLISFDEIEDDTPAKAEAASTETAESTEETESTETDSTETESTAEDLKMIKALRGENPYEIPEDAVFTQKVNGEDHEISLRELLNDYSGKTDWTRKYGEFSKEKREFTSSKSDFDTRVNTFVEKAKESKIDALAYLAETAGANPVDFIKEFKQGLIPDLEEYVNMSETEKELYDHKQELDILKRSQETRTSLDKAKSDRLELEQQVTTAREELGLSEDEYGAAFQRLVDSGSIPQDQITTESIAQWVSMENRVDFVSDVLEGISPELVDDSAMVEQLVITTLNSGLDEESTRGLIEEYYSEEINASAKAASKKARVSAPNLKHVTNNITKEHNVENSDDDSIGLLSFDDL